MLTHLSPERLEQIAAIEGVDSRIKKRAERALRGWRARLDSDFIGAFERDPKLDSDADLDPWLRLNSFELGRLQEKLTKAGRTDLIEALAAEDEVAPYGHVNLTTPVPAEIVLAVMEAGVFTGRIGHDIEKVLAVAECLYAGMIRERTVEITPVPIKIKVIAETLAGYGPARWREAITHIVGDLIEIGQSVFPAGA